MPFSPFRPFLRLILPSLLCAAAAQATPPVAPLINTLTWNQSNGMNITWQDRSTDEDGFVIAYRLLPNGNYQILTEIPANVTSFNQTLDPSFRICNAIIEWTVASFKGSGTSREYSSVVSTKETLPPPPVGQTSCPPVFRSANYFWGTPGTAFNQTLTAVKRNTTNGALVNITTGYSVTGGTGLPPGLTVSAAGVITGTPTAVGRYNFTVNVQEAGGLAATQAMKIYTFRPVPSLVPPVNGTPLPARSLRRGAAATTVDLGTHFSDPDVSDATRLTFNTGSMDFLYYPSAAPANVANFKGYVTRGDFVNTIIHRSIPGFVLQGGGYKALAGTPSITRQPAVVNEPEITNARGTVAMAKSASSPDSATSEFFVSLADNSSNLNNQNEGFTVFARVPAAGMAVADAIAALPIRNYSTTNGVLTDCPVTTPPPAAFDPASLVKLITVGPVSPLSYQAVSSAPAVCGVAVNGSQLSLTPVSGGTASINVTATDLDNQPINRSFDVLVEEHLSDWLTAQNFPQGADATGEGDPDNDGAANVMEFALMTNPQSSTPRPAPLGSTAVSGADQFLSLAFPVRKFAGTGLVYTVEAAGATAGPWTALWTSTDGFAHARVVSSTDQADRTDVTIADSQPITAGSKRFLRLRVTETP